MSRQRDHDRVALDPRHREARSGEGHRVETEAAAEVGDMSGTGIGVPLGSEAGDDGAGRLLESALGEEQARCVWSEARARTPSQSHLRERGGQEPGVDAGVGATQVGGGAYRVDGPAVPCGGTVVSIVVVRRGSGQDVRALGGGQPRDDVEVHAASLPEDCAPGWSRRRRAFRATTIAICGRIAQSSCVSPPRRHMGTA